MDFIVVVEPRNLTNCEVDLFFLDPICEQFWMSNCRNISFITKPGQSLPTQLLNKNHEWWHQTTAATEWIMPLFKQTSGHGPWLAKNQTSPQQKSYYFMFDRLISPFFHDFSSILLFWGVYPSFLSHNHLNFRSVVISGLPHGFPHAGSWTFEIFGGFNTERKDQSMTWPIVEVIISTQYFTPILTYTTCLLRSCSKVTSNHCHIIAAYYCMYQNLWVNYQMIKYMYLKKI